MEPAKPVVTAKYSEDIAMWKIKLLSFIIKTTVS